MINFVIGPSGAGKTTYIKKHAKDNGIVIDWDDIRETINDKDNRITSFVVAFTLRECVSLDMSCWVSAVVPNRMELEAIRGADVNWIFIDASKEQVIRNRRKRNRFDEREMDYDSLSSYYEWNIREIEKFINENNIEVERIVPNEIKERW